jgi:hypothetical protein
MWLGAMFPAGINGLFLDELTRARTTSDPPPVAA